MKRLGLFVATVVFAVSLFGVVSTSRVNAQTTDIQRERATATAQPTASKQDLLNSGNAVFETFLSELAQRQANPGGFDITKNLTPANLAIYLERVQNLLIPSIKDAQSIFVKNFNAPPTTSTNLYADYTTALGFAKTSINQNQQQASSLYTPPLQQEVTALSKKLENESKKQQNLYIAVGNTAAASALQNAVGVQTTAAANKELAESKCSLFLPTKILGCIDVVFNWIIKNVFLEIAIFLVWITANMFNYSVQIGILDFAKWAPDALYPIWIIIRQIISLLIVFIGLYLGLMYILGRDTKFQKYIPWVIMFALFVNFSYPLARTAVDISNVVSLNIYASAVGSKALDASFSSEETAGAIIRNKLGLQSLLSGVTSVQNSPNIRKELNSTPASLMAVAFALYAAYIFFIAAIIMATRTAALVFLIVASPLLLVDSVLPMLGEKAKLLRKIFFEQLAVGPIFMIMLALTLKFLDVFQASGAFGAASAGDQTIRTFFNLLMMLIMLHIMITVTKKTAGAVGEFGTNMLGQVGGFATGAAVGVATGGAGLLARKSLGALAAKARDSSDKWMQKSPNSLMARGAYNLSNSVANSTFDLRNTAVAQKYAGKLGISSGMGAGAKMGYEGEAKKKVEEIQARSARIKTKFERDVIKDGKVAARKGEIDPEGVKAKERFYQNQGGALFLTKQQQEDLSSSFVDESSSKDMDDYKKITNKDKRAVFAESLKAQLEAVNKGAGNTTSPKAQALMRTIYEIGEKEKQDKIAFDTQLEKEVGKYNEKSTEKRKDHLANLEQDMREALKSRIDPQTGNASMPKPQTVEPIATPQPVEPIATPQPLTGSALRQERLQKVATGRASSVTDAEKKMQAEKKFTEEVVETNQRIKNEVLENYEKDLANLKTKYPTSSILDSKGNATVSSAMQAEIDKLDERKNANLRHLNREINRSVESVQKDAQALQQSLENQKSSAAKATVFAENRNQGSSGIPASQQFDVTQVNFAAITRAAKLKRAAQAAQSEMAKNTKGTPPENPGVAMTNPTPKPPITPGVSATKDPATV